MTSASAPLLLRDPRRAVRADSLLVAVLLAAVAGLLVLWLAAGFAAPPPRAAAPPRVALVVDAGARPAATLDGARALASRAERTGAADVDVRVPGTAAEAAADVRYFAAQGSIGRVVVVGPLANGAARAAADDYLRARFVARAGVPRTLR